MRFPVLESRFSRINFRHRRPRPRIQALNVPRMVPGLHRFNRPEPMERRFRGFEGRGGGRIIGL